MSLAAVDAADRVEQLTALTLRLTERLTDEARLFEARRPQDVAPGLEETGRLANLYRHESMRIKADPSLISGAPLAARQKLAQATLAFEQMMERHAQALQAARTVTEGIVQTLAREVASARAPGAGYGAGGRATAGDATSVTLNRRA